MLHAHEHRSNRYKQPHTAISASLAVNCCTAVQQVPAPVLTVWVHSNLISCAASCNRSTSALYLSRFGDAPPAPAHHSMPQ